MANERDPQRKNNKLIGILTAGGRTIVLWRWLRSSLPVWKLIACDASSVTETDDIALRLTRSIELKRNHKNGKKRWNEGMTENEDKTFRVL